MNRHHGHVEKNCEQLENCLLRSAALNLLLLMQLACCCCEKRLISSLANRVHSGYRQEQN
jgi:hypothetical protein